MAVDKLVDSTQLDSDLTSVANAIRTKGGTSEQLAFPAGFVSAIEVMASGGKTIKPVNEHIGEDGKWHRPQAWPNLDELPAVANADYFYLTLNNTTGDAFMTVSCTTGSGQWTIERGTVSGTTFTVAETASYNSNSNANGAYREWNNNWGDYPVFRVSASGGITGIYLGNSPVINTASVSKNSNRLVEARLVISSYCDIEYFAELYNLERFSFVNGKVSKFNFNSCFMLAEIKGIEDWDVSTVTSLHGRFGTCLSLLELDLHKWNISSVTSLGNNGGSTGIFANSYSLRKLNLKGWTSNSNIGNNAQGIFANCFSLKEVDASGWNIPNVTRLKQAFYCCYLLEKLDLTNWKTSNCTDFNAMFQNCYNLREIKGIEDWDVSSGTDFAYMFSGLKSIDSLDLHKWEFKSSGLGSVPYFSGCAMDSLDIHGWDISGLTANPHLFTFYNDSCIRSANLSGITVPAGCTNFRIDHKYIREYYPPIINESHTYSNVLNLDHASLLRILNVLPETETTKTLTLSSIKAKLTAEELAIATNKGWTIA